MSKSPHSHCGSGTRSIAAILLFLTSCVVQSPEAPPDLRDVPPPIDVYQLRWLQQCGTAIPLQDGLIASVLHVFPPEIQVAELDDVVTPIEVVYRGPGEAKPAEDWVVFRAPDAPTKPGVPVDFDCELQIGDEVIAVGFEGTERVLKSYKTTVCPPPTGFDPIDPRALLLAAGTHPQYGMSGGAVVSMRNGSPVLVAIIWGQAEYTNSEGAVIGGRLLGIRPVIEQLRNAGKGSVHPDPQEGSVR